MKQTPIIPGKYLTWLLTLLLAALWAATAVSLAAQEEAPALQLRLSRDFGFEAAGSIEGRFSYRVAAPESIVRVVFLMDGASIAEDDTPPFRYQFETATFDPGVHTMSAVGYTVAGEALTSNTITRQFLTESAGNNFTRYVIGGTLAIVVAAGLVSWWLSRRGKTTEEAAVTGPFGTAVCPNCGKPFARHLWAPNLITGRLDRCPHCGKWNLVRRASPEAVAEAMKLLRDEEEDGAAAVAPSAEETLRQRLDESRFEE